MSVYNEGTLRRINEAAFQIKEQARLSVTSTEFSRVHVRSSEMVAHILNIKCELGFQLVLSFIK